MGEETEGLGGGVGGCCGFEEEEAWCVHDGGGLVCELRF